MKSDSKMKSSIRGLPRFAFANRSSKVADLDTSQGQAQGDCESEVCNRSTPKSPILSHQGLEKKYKVEGYLNVYDLPPPFTPDFLMLYKISSFKKRFEETILNLVENITNTIDDLIGNTYSAAMSLTEINCFLWFGVECFTLIDSKPTQFSTSSDFKNLCKIQIAMLAQSSISSKKMVKAFRRKMVPYNNLLHACFRMAKQDYSKYFRKAKILFKEYLTNEGNKVIFEGKDLLGKIRICSHKAGFSIMCKERWENGEGIPRETLEELVKLTLSESSERMKCVRNDFSKIFPQVVRNHDSNLGASDADAGVGDNTNCSTLQINVDKALRLLHFRQIRLEENGMTEILLAFLKLEKRVNQLDTISTKLGLTAKYLSCRLTKIEKKLEKTKFKLRKNKSPFFSRKTCSVDGGLFMGLMKEWPEILNDLVITSSE